MLSCFRSENKKIPDIFISPYNPSSSFINLFNNMTNIKDFYLSDFKQPPMMHISEDKKSGVKTQNPSDKQYKKSKKYTQANQYTNDVGYKNENLYTADIKYIKDTKNGVPKQGNQDTKYNEPKQYSSEIPIPVKQYTSPKEYLPVIQYTAPEKQYTEADMKLTEEQYSPAKQYEEDTDLEMENSADNFIRGSYTTSRPWSFFSRGDSWIPPFTLPFPLELFPTEKVGLTFLSFIIFIFYHSF